MKDIRIAIILAGCGFKDGSEIREAVLSLTALSMAGAEFECFAPDKTLEEVDHLSFQPTGNTRSLLREAARIARGKIKALNELNAAEFGGLMLPGGFGVAKNLCNFAQEGAHCRLDSEVERVLASFIEKNKPMAAVCIAPVMLAVAFKKQGGIRLTLGPESEAARAIETMGSRHIVARADEAVIDADRKVVSTPAYMYDNADLKDIFSGIQKAANQLVSWC